MAQIQGKPMDACITKQSQVSKEMDQLFNSLDALSVAINNFIDEKLPGVLRSESVPTCGEAAKEEILVPLADSIRQARYRINEQKDKIQDICHRIEI
jgi:hypothetical protein